MYDIVARCPGDNVPKVDDVRLMLQSLLADRFKLRVHRESKEMPVYSLQVGKSGSRLKPASADSQCSVQTRLASDGRNSEETFTACPVERLADRLGNLMHDRPVLDQTGLTGKYDFHLVLTPEYRSRNQSNPADISPRHRSWRIGLEVGAAEGASRNPCCRPSGKAHRQLICLPDFLHQPPLIPCEADWRRPPVAAYNGSGYRLESAMVAGRALDRVYPNSR
jgi:Protein of unknown function (DUF3738)